MKIFLTKGDYVVATATAPSFITEGENVYTRIVAVEGGTYVVLSQDGVAVDEAGPWHQMWRGSFDSCWGYLGGFIGDGEHERVIGVDRQRVAEVNA